MQKGDKYDWKQEDDTYTLTINNPQLDDDGDIVIIPPLELNRISLFQAHTFSW